MADLPITSDQGAMPVVVTDAATTANTLKVFSDGSTAVAPIDGKKATYSSAFQVTAAAAATDICILNGSATKTVRILKVSISGTQTTAGQVFVILIKRSAANTGGTSTTVGGVSHDSTDGNFSSAIMTIYTANPTGLGATVGALRQDRLFLPAVLTTSEPSLLIWNSIWEGGKAFVLRGVAEGISINLNGTTVAGGLFEINYEWTEE